MNNLRWKENKLTLFTVPSHVRLHVNLSKEMNMVDEEGVNES